MCEQAGCAELEQGLYDLGYFADLPETQPLTSPLSPPSTNQSALPLPVAPLSAFVQVWGGQRE